MRHETWRREWGSLNWPCPLADLRLGVFLDCTMSEEEGSEEERELFNGAVDGERDEKGGNEVETKDKVEETKKENGRKKKKSNRICYLSRIPPNMDPASLRHMLSQYGEIDRIYLVPSDTSAAQGRRKRSGGPRGQAFSEGWVEFAKKGVAKRVANMLNGEQMGGRRRSSFYYDIWNIKYLSKFKWDDLTEEIAYKNASREQKLALEISAFAQARAINAIEERLNKKRRNGDVGFTADDRSDKREAKIYRQFSQNRPFGNTNQKKGTLSKDILAGKVLLLRTCQFPAGVASLDGYQLLWWIAVNSLFLNSYHVQ
ncbi:unnamed protein product [Spirodela intermedia]|uniref:RRM domain-containing protein n=1 Tax=Spirodela intermedia TaxID=51605 RepID=A0A7I8J1N0_SPIIN|nr:unnamed protein product [Spirodela intermedia]CAA6664126.1 unnamed protein product [Spirodela intermedia]